MPLRSMLKNGLDRYAPLAGKAYRDYRSYRKLQQLPRLHAEGFKFIGDDEMLAGRFEVDEVRILREWIPTVDRFIDIGANVGYHTCIARKIGKPVVAFEPLPSNFSILFANLQANNWLDTEVWPIGLSDNVGMSQIFGAGTAASLIKGWASQTNSIGTPIALNTLDNVLAERFESERLFIKIDVEGFELKLLQGARKVLGRLPRPAVLIEIALKTHHPEPNKHYLQTFQLFWDLGYRIMTADVDRREVRMDDVLKWVEAGDCAWRVHNWLAI